MSVTGPGFHAVAESDYHADTNLAPELGRSLSTSGAKVLLESPAKFHYQREHGSGHKAVYDFGHAAHLYVLGVGEQVARVEADSWRTKEARTLQEEAYAAGHIPLLAHDDDKALALADAVKSHPTAGPWFTGGDPEQSLYWLDAATGITRRGRVDYLRHDAVIDLKSSADASAAGFAKSVANYGYDMQAAAYVDGVESLTGERLPFYFVVVEKEPPHLVALYELDDESMAVGRIRNAEACALYAQCQSDDEWPGYPTEIQTLSSPAWHTRQYQGALL
jgi:hypothetical protein